MSYARCCSRPGDDRAQALGVRDDDHAGLASPMTAPGMSTSTTTTSSTDHDRILKKPRTGAESSEEDEEEEDGMEDRWDG